MDQLTTSSRLVGGRVPAARDTGQPNGDDDDAAGAQQPLEPLRARVILQNAALVFLCAVSLAQHVFMPGMYQEYYGIGSGSLAAMTMVFFSTHILTGPWIVALLREHGAKRTLEAASAMHLLSTVFKVASVPHGSFTLLLTGQCAAAVSMEVALSAPAMIAAGWFPRDERTSAVVTVVLSETLGFAVAAILPLLVAFDAVRQSLLLFFGLLLAAAGAELASSVFLRPPFPFYGPGESEAAAVRASALDSQLVGLRGFRHVAWKLLTQNYDFCILTATAGVAIAFTWVYTFTMPAALGVFGFSEATTGAMTTLKLLAAVPPAMVCASLMDNNRKYRKMLLILLGLAALFVALLTVSVYSMRPSDTGRSAAFVIVVGGFNVFLGIAQTALPAVAIEHAVEVSFPVDAAAVGGVFMWLAHGIAAVIALAVMLLVPPGWEAYTVSRAWGKAYFMVFAVVSVLAFLGAFFVSSRRRRHEDELDRDAACAADDIRHAQGANGGHR